MTTGQIGLRPDLGFLLSNFEQQVPGSARTIAVSVDGLVQCASASITSREQGEQLGAICCGMASLVIGLAKQLGAGPVANIGVRLDIGFVIIAGPFDNAYLMTLADPRADMGVVNQELLKLGEAIREAMSPQCRNPHQR